jgi:hypothetical protein
MEKIKEPLGDLLEASLRTNIQVTSAMDAPIQTTPDPVEFSFDIKILKIEGKIWKSGKLDFTGTVLGMQIGHTVIDVTKEVCFNPSIGFEEVKYCFYRRGSCLRTKGYVDGWFHEKLPWDSQIVCF